MSTSSEATTATCSFCGTPRARAGRLVDGPGLSICAECVLACREILSEAEPDDGDLEARVPSPVAIRRHLDQWVVGQERAKKRLAVSVHSHYQRARHVRRSGPGEIELDKSNVLLIGPTGTGKTHLARSLAAWLDVPIHFADATSLTEAGYVGEDVESIVAGLYAAADQDADRCQHGIILLDEVDKLSSRSGQGLTGRDVGGEGVQNALLRLLEGRRVTLRPKKGRRRGGEIIIDTRGILFILCGAFVGLDGIVERRLGRRQVGFGGPPRPNVSVDAGAANSAPELPVPEPQDLVAYGLTPEFVGRIGSTATLHDLDEAALTRILTEPRGSLVRQYQRLFRMDGIALRFTQDALLALARRARDRGLGARGLRGELEQVLLPLMFELPSRDDVREVWINGETVEGEAEPELVLRSRTG